MQRAATRKFGETAADRAAQAVHQERYAWCSDPRNELATEECEKSHVARSFSVLGARLSSSAIRWSPRNEVGT